MSAGGAQGAVTCRKGSGASQLAVDPRSGAVQVKKGTPRGTYTMKVRVCAAGDATHAPATQVVTVTVKVV